MTHTLRIRDYSANTWEDLVLEVGQEVHMSRARKHRPGEELAIGRVTKITKTGQFTITVATATGFFTIRFMPDGSEIGGSSWDPKWHVCTPTQHARSLGAEKARKVRADQAAGFQAALAKAGKAVQYLDRRALGDEERADLATAIAALVKLQQDMEG